MQDWLNDPSCEFEFANRFNQQHTEASLKSLFYLYMGVIGANNDLLLLLQQKDKAMSNNKNMQILNVKIKNQKKIIAEINQRIQSDCTNTQPMQWREGDFINDQAFNNKFNQFRYNHLLMDIIPQVHFFCLMSLFQFFFEFKKLSKQILRAGNCV